MKSISGEAQPHSSCRESGSRTRLYTRHSSEFDIRTDRRDYSKSTYREHAGYLGASKALSDYLGTDQFLWCVCDTRPLGKELGKERQWTLLVQEKQILGYVNEELWRKRWGDESISFQEIVTNAPTGTLFSVLVQLPLASADIERVD